MPEPDERPPLDDMRHCAAAHARLLASIADLTERELREPSGLEGWSRAHVLAHLAANGDSVLRRLSGALRGEVVQQYAGGAAGRAAEIEQGARRGAGEILSDVGRTARAVDEIFASFPDEAWSRPIHGLDGPDRPARRAAFSRWREVEAHHVDLLLGYTVADWPEELVARWLPDTLTGLRARTDQRALLAWTIGRGEAPELGPWG